MEEGARNREYRNSVRGEPRHTSAREQMTFHQSYSVSCLKSGLHVIEDFIPLVIEDYSVELAAVLRTPDLLCK